VAALLALVAVSASAAPDPSAGSSTTVKLIQLLIKNGVLTQDQAAALLQQAEQEAAETAPKRRAPAAATKTAAAPAAAAAAAADAAAPPPAGSVRVTYVPPLVRDQIAAEVKQQLQADAKNTGWAETPPPPDWTPRVRVSGDVRFRGEYDGLDHGNYPYFPDFNTINNSANGYDVNGTTLPPLLNTTEDRNRFRLRARLDVSATPDDWVSTDLRIATGTNDSPVSTNQTLGNPSDFSKYQIWLDRAYIDLHPTGWLNVDAGRAPNPFWTTSLLFGDDLNFDGVSLQGHTQFTPGIGAFLTLGGFPVFNTDFNFGSTNAQKNSSHDAYLLAVQGGGEWKITDDYVAKLGVGYFDFANVQASQSAPCLTPTGYGSCSTDDQRAGFVQFGNTLFPLRNITVDTTTTNTAQPQYFGLASRFDVLDVHGQFSLLNLHPIDIVLGGDYAKNLGFNRSAILARGPSNNLGTNNAYQSGDTGYAVSLKIGHQELAQRWDWNASAEYRYLEADAVLDALTDSDFHLGGTNAKGYIVAANLALARSLWLSGKWLSATQVSGAPYSANVLLVDLNAKF
jgi:hypothetical protein